MSMTILYAADPEEFDLYRQHVTQALAQQGVSAQVVSQAPPDQVDVILYAPTHALQDFAPFTRCRLVQSLWAGVERIVGNASLTQPLCRLVDPALTQGMVEYVTGHVLRHHLGMDAQIVGQNGRWVPVVPPLASERPVGLLGLGELGQACGQMLASIGFPVLGWSRNPKQITGIRCHAGETGLNSVLEQAQILVTLLPLTPQTDSLLNAERLARLPQGSALVNPGRGRLIDDDALLAALARGQVGHATLDVFRTEPLPPEHPFWAHPRVTVTPHIAAATRPHSAARVAALNILRLHRGEALHHQVDRNAGY
jgi:glyoxylate/hydroxypyruvate reductase A